ncbi:hypothetical protein [Alistipes ihumii]|uniref:hypothetical protein n=1 Tax=Alistipes ihumii TaxID=1470347 RepID=UPI003AB6F5FA
MNRERDDPRKERKNLVGTDYIALRQVGVYDGEQLVPTIVCGSAQATPLYGSPQHSEPNRPARFPRLQATEQSRE